jgi:hypothetical protein
MLDLKRIEKKKPMDGNRIVHPACLILPFHSSFVIKLVNTATMNLLDAKDVANPGNE